jgi:hypothetical protein
MEMNQDMNVSTDTPASPLRALLLAIVAPFGAIALLATPLAFDALKHAAGL